MCMIYYGIDLYQITRGILLILGEILADLAFQSGLFSEIQFFRRDDDFLYAHPGIAWQTTSSVCSDVIRCVVLLPYLF